MTSVEASNLANEYRSAKPSRAREILEILRSAGWRRLAELLEGE